MRVLVCGSHRYCDVDFLTTVLDDFHTLHSITTLIHGNAEKTDKAAGTCAIYKGIPVLSFPAQWKTYGKVAGPIRNLQMLEEGKPDFVIAFPIGDPGTANMIKQAEEYFNTFSNINVHLYPNLQKELI
jgi:YspA, cpYpsA-related SLOG family